VIRVRLAELLEEKGKSRYWLAKETGLTPLTITKLFRGETNGIDFPTLNVICAALKCQTNDVIVFENEEQNKLDK
jgi:putative transcriptional regulator